MPFGEGTAGTRLQIFLEANGVSFIPKLDRNDKRPGPVVHCITTRPAIVPIEAFVYVLSDADVMTFRICVAANDVHESLAKALHGR
jgi:hypothetical protein